MTNKMNFFTPEKSKSFLKLYHKSNYSLLPLVFLTAGLSQTPFQDISKLLQFGTTLTYTYHSYVSTSFVLTDYVKPYPINSLLRALSMKVHLLALLGFSKVIFTENQKLSSKPKS